VPRSPRADPGRTIVLLVTPAFRKPAVRSIRAIVRWLRTAEREPR
jgi:hypothetical protein